MILRLLGLDDVRFGGAELQKLLTLLVVCALCSALTVSWVGTPTDAIALGDVAPRTVKAPYDLRYQDFAAREEAQAQARATVLPVYRAELNENQSARVAAAFEAARTLIEAAEPPPLEEGDTESVPEGPPPPTAEELIGAFRSALGVHIPDDDLLPLVEAGFPSEAEAVSVDLLRRAMRGYVVADRALLPSEGGGIRVVESQGGEPSEITVTDLDRIRTPEEARQQVTLALLEQKGREKWLDAAGTVARASVTANLTFLEEQTEARRAEAASEVSMAPTTLKRGTTIFRQGDVVVERQILQYDALRASRSEHGPAAQFVVIGGFLLLVFSSLYHFGASYMESFSTRVRDVTAAGFLVVLTAVFARGTVGISEGIAEVLGSQATPEALWYAVPVAGAAMTVRLLVGVGWTMVFSTAAAVACALIMDLEALYLIYFLVSAVAAAGAVEHTRERMALLRAGVFTGLINAVAVLLIHFLELVVSSTEVGMATAMRPVWGMIFAFVGGVLSGVLVLALVPLFEAVGFVTDFRLMELANLNHPLLRQLMLRAPGTYHHSVIVGSLAEAACEEVGANALQARVAAYFHDIGKGEKPAYFVENQRGTNKHDKISPFQSAQIIISHVTEGGRMAKEHRLPRPIIDNIYMHHGTGLLAYFYRKALADADDPADVREQDFRYPGTMPSTREAGIVMLADKVEAATRTIKEPDEENIRAMINKIVNSVIADGQFANCPLTFREIYEVAESFVKVLTGIYHHRIEYADTADISSRSASKKPEPEVQPPAVDVASSELDQDPDTEEGPAVSRRIPPEKKASVITLELARPLGLEEDEDVSDPLTDYESVENLPRGS